MKHLPLLVVPSLAMGLVASWALAADEPAHATAEPAFENVIRLPQNLYTTDGRLIEQGAYRVRAEFDGNNPVLVFENPEKDRTVIEGRGVQGLREDGPAVPIAGTMFLRSSDDPVGTDEERHHSKTGLPQYQETERDWKATLRMYRYPDDARKDVLLLFQKRLPDGLWESTEFWVRSASP